MNKTDYHNLQVSYLTEARNFYKEKNDLSRTDSRSGVIYYRLLKQQRRSMSLKRLRTELKGLSPADFTRSNDVCNCRLGSLHYKLQHNDILICPISLGIQWTRLRLVGLAEVDFRIEELIERSKP